MKQTFLIKTKCSLLLGFILILSGCNQRIEKETDMSAGLNGGFEISRNGLPVNWLMYTPKTVPESDFEIVLDREVFKEGKQSLKFEVEKCSSVGGWRAPGFTNEFIEVGKFEGSGSYKMSFWIKSIEAKFNISAGGVSPNEGDMKTLLEDEDQIDNWKFFEYEIDIPKDKWLRMQLNILYPGTLWIDDIRIEKI